MTYRNGTYIAFHADGTNIPTESDFKYYNLIRAWIAKDDDDFFMVNSHEKTGAARDGSKRETLRNHLKERLRNSKNMILIVGETTKNDRDWIPFEIEYAVDACEIPLIVAYPGCGHILQPPKLSYKWPESLKERIENETVYAIHIPFKKEPLKAAISQFDHNNKPNSALSYYSEEAYRRFGIL